MAHRDLHSPDPYRRFIASMHIGYAEWHDGIPYDLEALDQMTPNQRAQIERKLIARRNKDWRDSDALGRLGSPAAIKALVASTSGPERAVRLRAGEILHEKGVPVDLDSLIVDALRHGGHATGGSEALGMAERYPSPAVVRTLLQGARYADDDQGREVFFPALLLYLHGQAPEAFDDSQQDFFQQFHTSPGPRRERVFLELCQRIGVDPATVTNADPFPKADEIKVWGPLIWILVLLTMAALALVGLGFAIWWAWSSLTH